jgi:cobalt-zinc-cadmium efflux system protein
MLNHFTCCCQLPRDKSNLLSIVLVITIVFATSELTIGDRVHSLSLMADAKHVMVDAVAIGISLLASYLTRRRVRLASANWEALAALINGLSLLIIGGSIACEVWLHWQSSNLEIVSFPMLIAALVSLFINSLNLWLLHKNYEDNINLQSTFAHLLTDVASSIGATIAAIAIWFQGWYWADTLMSSVVAILVCSAALKLIKQSWNELWKKPSFAISAAELLKIQAAVRNKGVYSLKDLLTSQNHSILSQKSD